LTLDYLLLAFAISFFMGLLEVISIMVVRHEVSDARQFYEGKDPAGDIINRLDAYLCEQENPDDAESPSRLEAIGEIIGRTIFQAGKYSALQSKSVDARIQNKYDNLIQDGIRSKMPPKLKLLQRVLEEVGVDIDIMELMDAGELPYLERSAKKFGLGSLLKNDGQGSSQGVM